MDDFTEDAFANRESPVPLIGLGDSHSLEGLDDSDSGTPIEGKRALLKKHATNLKDNFMKGQKRSESRRSFSIQDRLLERYAGIVNGYEEAILTTAGYYSRSSPLKTSLPTMTTTPVATTTLKPLLLI